jgi:hypothetical protein
VFQQFDKALQELVCELIEAAEFKGKQVHSDCACLDSVPCVLHLLTSISRETCKEKYAYSTPRLRLSEDCASNIFP